DAAWPQALRDDVPTLLQEGYDRAEEMLKPNPLPDHINLHKLDALARSASHAEGKFYRVPINVTFEDKVNHVGVEQQACTLCGDCRETPAVEMGTITEEGSIPGALGPLLPIAMAASANALGHDTDHGIGDEVKEKAREVESLVHGPYHGAVQNTQIYLVMAND